MEGRLHLSELDHSDAKTPDVNLGVVRLVPESLAGHHLWGHPVWCADEGVSLLIVLLELGADSKVGELDVPLQSEQDVAGLEVSVDDPVPVEIEEAVHHLTRHIGDLLLREALAEIHDDGVQSAAVTILDEHLETRNQYSRYVVVITRHSRIMMTGNCIGLQT